MPIIRLLNVRLPAFEGQVGTQPGKNNTRVSWTGKAEALRWLLGSTKPLLRPLHLRHSRHVYLVQEVTDQFVGTYAPHPCRW